MKHSWHKMTALQLGTCIANNSINPVELTEYFLKRISEHDNGHLIYVRSTAERAYKEAEAAGTRAKAGITRSPLDGVPISWKDLYDTAGTLTEGGTPLLSGRRPTRDAQVLERATNAGLVCLGKTNTVQFALGGIGTNPYTGTPPNAVMTDVPRAPGGSSCGAAVSVASGLAAAGIGSDTGGSVRVPAAWNSLVGFKTSYGALPLDGVLPLAPSLDTVGPLTKSVADAAELFAILGARNPVDLQGLKPASQLRLLSPTNVVWDQADQDVDSTIRKAIDSLSSLGATVVHENVPEFDHLTDVVGQHGGIAVAEAYAAWRHFVDTKSAQIDPNVLTRFQQGRDMSAPDVEIVRAEVRSLAPALYQSLASFDAMVMPTVAVIPPELEAVQRSADAYNKANILTLRNTTLGNLLPSCAVTLPIAGEIPCGLMVMAPAGHDNRLLRVAAAIEKALDLPGSTG
ncbi:MAG: amidase [Rhodospirillaceae bacterium]|nr:amidase [Rhodospirillaceae bacterium]